MKKASLLLAVIAFAAYGFAQSAPSPGALAQRVQKDAQVAPLGTDVCQSTFTSGSGVSYMVFCTTQNGNISKFESPQGWNQLFHGGEGYGVCDQTDYNSPIGYYDWGIYGSSGLQDPVITQPNGPNSFPLTVTRTSADGVWTLKQVFSRNVTTPAVKITMTLKNNTGVTRQLYLERFADVDADGAPGYNFFDDDKYGAWGYTDHGLTMRATTNPVFSVGGIVPPSAPDPCHVNNFKATPYEGDAATFYEWDFTIGNALAPGASKTVVLEYRAF